MHSRSYDGSPSIRQDLISAGKLTPADFDDKLDWIYYELWHHEGWRARHGAAMSGPDYAWWHGMYEVAKKFYSEWKILDGICVLLAQITYELSFRMN